MKITAARLLSDALTVDLPRAQGEPHRFEVARGVNVRGTVEDDASGALRLSGVAADEIDVTSAVVTISGVRVALPALINGLELDLTIPRGDQGSLGGKARAASISTGGVSVRTSSFTVDAGEVSLENARLTLGDAIRVTAAVVRARNVVLPIGGTQIVVEELSLHDAVLVKEAEGLSVGASTVKVGGVVVSSGNLAIKVRRAGFKDLQYVRGAFRASEAQIEEISVAVTGLDASKPGGEDRSSAPPAPLPDLTFLDRLKGHLDLDLTIGLRVPIIKKYEAKNHFNVPIADGTIDFHELERDLSFLEDAVIDFEVEPTRLVLEKDFPLIPWDEEPIVYWPLDAENHALAEKHLVRLRTLANLKFPVKKPEDDKEKKGVQLARVDLDGIRSTLALGGPTRVEIGPVAITLGTDERDGVDELTLHGSVKYRPDQAVPEPGEVSASAKNIVGGIQRVALGSRVLSADGFAIGAVSEAVLALSGVKPTALSIVLAGVVLAQAEIA